MLGTIKSLITAVIFSILSACVQLDLRKTDEDCEFCSFEKSSSYNIAYVDIRDSGLYLHPPQVDRLEAELEKLLSSCEKVIVPVFVHGWKGSSQPNEQSVKDFKTMLAGIENTEAQVFGVYVGWRGQSWIWEPLSLSTFGARRKAAKSVGLGQIQELLAQLDTIQKSYASTNCGSMELVVFGHSLGGYIVFEAIWRDIVRQARIKSREQPETPLSISGIGNRIVLLNPAISAIDYALFHDGLEKIEFPLGTKPIFEIYASDSDTVIHNIFRIFRGVQSVTFDPSESRRMLNTPVSAIDEFVTKKIDELSCEPLGTQHEPFPSRVIRVSNVQDFAGHGDIWKLVEKCVKTVIHNSSHAS